jgi:hypothetical protein
VVVDGLVTEIGLEINFIEFFIIEIILEELLGIQEVFSVLVQPPYIVLVFLAVVDHLVALPGGLVYDKAPIDCGEEGYERGWLDLQLSLPLQNNLHCFQPLR